jgi:alpha-amylase/alpha-mannosidase (GH57 family)
VVRLMTRGENFSHADRMTMFQLIGAQIRDIIPRYRRLAESGRVEISTTPHYHPIGPLLLDFSCAREATPQAPLPAADHYSGGRSRIVWHLESAQHSHRRRFDAVPPGVWPAEGALSTPFLKLLAEHRVAWTASGERILVNTLRKAGLPADDPHDFLYRPYCAQFDGHRVDCFFRDDRLSDLIGFEYKGWHGKEACNHFIGQLEQIGTRALDASPVVSVILDGENAWEYYPYNAFYFLDSCRFSDMRASGLPRSARSWPNRMPAQRRRRPSSRGRCRSWYRVAGYTAICPRGSARSRRTARGTCWPRPSRATTW